MLGDVVDRAARLQSVALPGQVLIDDPLYQVIRGELMDKSGIHVDTDDVAVKRDSPDDGRRCL